MKRSRILYYICFSVGFMLAGLVWLASPLPTFGQPDIPHRLEERENCLSCHATGEIGIPQMPAVNHDWHTSNSCKKCHDPVASYAPLTPHKLAGREDCVACHLPEAAAAELAAQTVEVVVSVPPPVTFRELTGETDNCVACHLTAGDELAGMTHDWQSSIHAERGVICASCHGGDPNAEDMDSAKSPETGYIGKPERADIPDLCGSCHADVTLMRQYDLPTDQLAKYRESFHGERLAEGDTKVAVCFDCHDGHATRKSNDPQASVYTLNVPALCANCHADADYMAEYSIPTDQYALYKDSVHGIALLDHQNTRAPNCATCHGTHGATPPGFAEVANVCGSCHDATQNYYTTSAHFSNDPETPRCVTCHGRYDVQKTSEAMFIGSEPRHCGSCHAPDTEIGGTVNEIHQALVEANTALAEAKDMVEQAAALGMIVNEEEVLLTGTFTRLVTARAAQHTVDLELVRQETDAAIELSQSARQLAESAIEENRLRQQAMVIALAVIGICILSLVLLRGELIARRSRKGSQ